MASIGVARRPPDAVATPPRASAVSRAPRSGRVRPSTATNRPPPLSCSSTFACASSLPSWLVLRPVNWLELSADQTQDSRTPSMEVLLLGGRPIEEPIAWYGPFVMNTKAEILEAIEDYQTGKMGSIPAETT